MFIACNIILKIIYLEILMFIVCSIIILKFFFEIKENNKF